MGNLKEAFQHIVQKIRPGTIFVHRDTSGVININMGEVPWNKKPTILIFPEGTSLFSKSVEEITEKDQEYLVNSWSSCDGMTIGYLRRDNEYFKALNDPQEVRELKIVGKK